MVYHHGSKTARRLAALAILGAVFLALVRLPHLTRARADASTRAQATPDRVLIAQQGIETQEVALQEMARRQEVLASRAFSRQYDREDVYWLAKIVEAEAEGEPYDGKIAVANVVLNRVDTGWGKTIREVIFQKGQFQPVANGRIYKVVPTEETKNAVLDALAGKETVPSSVVYFQNPEIATDSYITVHETWVATIGNHAFYE